MGQKVSMLVRRGIPDLSIFVSCVLEFFNRRNERFEILHFRKPRDKKSHF